MLRHSVSRMALVVVAVAGLVGCGRVTPTGTPTSPAPALTATVPPTATPGVTPTATLAPVVYPTYADKIGVDLGGVNERGMEFVDLGKTLRPWENVNADSCPEGDEACRRAPLDEHGWPATDARTVFFDVRPFGAWWSADQRNCPLCRDGDFQMGVSGMYQLSFTGQGAIVSAEGTVNVQNQAYDEATNTTTADVVVAPGQGLLFVTFVDTKRTPDSPANTGIADVQLIRPGFPAGASETFTPQFLKAVEPFRVLRFMNWVGGNDVNPPYDAPDHTLDWSERNRPDELQVEDEGVAWEYVIELANLAGKDVWINLQTPKYRALTDLAGLTQSVPPTPVDVRLTAEGNRVTLEWSPGYGADGYIVKRKVAGGSYAPVAQVTATAFTDTGLDHPPSYFYVVSAVNGLGESGDSVAVSASLRQEPTPTPKPEVVPLEAHLAAMPPALDGQVDAAWEGARAYPIANTIGGEVADEANLSAQVALLYDVNNLYVLFVVTDDALVKNVGDNPWADDSAEVYLDGHSEKATAYDGNDEQYVFRFDDTRVWAQRGRDEGVEYATAATDSGYVVEVKIPWANVGVMPEADLVVGFDAHVNDDDGQERDGKIALFATQDQSWTDPSTFGAIRLLSES